MSKIDSVVIIDSDVTDNFISQKILKTNVSGNIYSFTNHSEAFEFLKQTSLKFQYIIIGYNPISVFSIDFTNRCYELVIDKSLGEVILLSASINPYDREMAKVKGIRFIEKPLTIESLLNKDNAY